MFKAHLQGTPDELKRKVEELKIDEDILGKDHIRALVIEHLPRYSVKPHTLSITCESAINEAGTRVAGYMHIAIMEV